MFNLLTIYFMIKLSKIAKVKTLFVLYYFLCFFVWFIFIYFLLFVLIELKPCESNQSMFIILLNFSIFISIQSSLWKLWNEVIKTSISLKGNGRFPIKYLMTYVSLLDTIYEQELFQSFCIDSYVFIIY